jgi:hypothetical protein
MDFWCNPNYRDNFILVLTATVIWTLPWKALALWKSARNGQKWWFLIFMIANTVGILEIFYLLVLPKFGRRK